MFGFIFACIIFGGVVRSFVRSVQIFVVPIIFSLSKVYCMQLNIVNILGSIIFTVMYKVILQYLANWTDTMAYLWFKMHINRQYPWMNETDEAMFECGPVIGITRIFWVVLAALQNRLLPCCHRHADAATTTVWNKSLTALTDVCSEWALSFSFFFLFPIQTYVHVKEANSHKCLHSMVFNVISAVAVDTCAFRYFLLLHSM